MTQQRATTRESLGKRISNWLSAGRKISEKEETIIKVVDYVLSLNKTEKVFPFDDRNCFIYNEAKNILIKVVGNTVYISTNFDIISETLSIAASNSVAKLVKASVRRDIERLKSAWKARESVILTRVENLIQDETISADRKE